jgi:hypothetical protein
MGCNPAGLMPGCAVVRRMQYSNAQVAVLCHVVQGQARLGWGGLMLSYAMLCCADAVLCHAVLCRMRHPDVMPGRGGLRGPPGPGGMRWDPISEY